MGSYETDIAVDNVDTFLLEKARTEAEIVSNRLMSRMFGRRNRRRNSVSPIKTLKLFMQPAVPGHLKSFINRIILDQISSSELIQFIRSNCYSRFTRAHLADFRCCQRKVLPKR